MPFHCCLTVDLLKTNDGKRVEKARYQPTVKFRFIDPSVLKAVQEKQTEVIDDDESESEADGKNDEVIPVTGLPEPIPPPAAATSVPFIVDPQIDLDARALLDMLTEKPVGQKKDANRTPDDASGRVVLGSAPEKASVADVDWDAL